MATFNPLHPLESSILEVIASKQGVSVRDLHTIINNECKITISLNGLYKPINRMLNSQMILKIKGKLFINRVWLQHIMQFTTIAKEHHLPLKTEDLSLPLQEGEHHDFVADSLQGLDVAWNHGLTKLTSVLQDDIWYVYDSHPWYSLGMRDTEIRLYESVIHQGKQINMLFGNSTFLDRYGKELITLDGFTTAIAEDAPFLKDGHALWVCDDHIVECVFPDVIARNFSFFFESVKSVSDFNQKLFADVFTMKCNCKVTIRCNGAEAKKLKALFRKYF